MQHRSEETRKLILDAALSAFSQSGYDATGVAEICRAAGVSKGAFYHHFPSKQAVFIALFEAWLAELQEELTRQGQPGLPVPQRLLAMADQFSPVFQAADGRLPMFLEFWIQAQRDPAIWQMTIEPYHRYQEFFARLLEEGIQEGSLNPVDVQSASRAIVALAVGVLLQGLLDPGAARWDQVIRAGLEHMLEGIIRRNP